MRMRAKLDPFGPITFLVAGSVDAACIADFERALGTARRLGKGVRLDLSEVTLVDHPGLQYLRDLARGEVILVNCPEHVERWMRQQPDPKPLASSL